MKLVEYTEAIEALGTLKCQLIEVGDKHRDEWFKENEETLLNLAGNVYGHLANNTEPKVSKKHTVLQTGEFSTNRDAEEIRDTFVRISKAFRISISTVLTRPTFNPPSNRLRTSKSSYPIAAPAVRLSPILNGLYSRELKEAQ